jgi:hypothetical protein
MRSSHIPQNSWIDRIGIGCKSDRPTKAPPKVAPTIAPTEKITIKMPKKRKGKLSPFKRVK